MTCKKCDGTGILSSGALCDCGAYKERRNNNVIPWIPIAYQGNNFMKDCLPVTLRDWGESLEKLQDAIIRGDDKLNYILISPYRSGKTVWAYDTLCKLGQKGYHVRDIVDLLDYRRCQLSFEKDDKHLMDEISSVQFLIVRIPTMSIPNLPSLIQTLQYTRTRYNGRTIYLYSGTYTELQESVQKPNALKALFGDGTLSSIKILNSKKGDTTWNT